MWFESIFIYLAKRKDKKKSDVEIEAPPGKKSA